VSFVHSWRGSVTRSMIGEEEMTGAVSVKSAAPAVMALSPRATHAISFVFIVQFLWFMSQPITITNGGPDRCELERKSAAIVL
jgi:hypothetical protein